MKIDPQYFFVYGTLKSGYGNNRVLGDSVKVGDAISSSFDFYLGQSGIPFASHVGPERGRAVLGEVYKVEDDTTIRRLDALEGNGSFYTRRQHQFTLLDTKEEVTAWIYLVPTIAGSECPVDPDFDAYHWYR